MGDGMMVATLQKAVVGQGVAVGQNTPQKPACPTATPQAPLKRGPGGGARVGRFGWFRRGGANLRVEVRA